MTDNKFVQDIQDAVRSRYAEVSTSAEGRFNYPTGREGAIFLGYDINVVGSLNDELVESFCGVGNPFKLGPINPGESVLDIGAGRASTLLLRARWLDNGAKYAV